MKATFHTSVVLGYLLLAYSFRPGKATDTRKLQNFLLSDPNWETSTNFTNHLGEPGEIETLRKALGEEWLEKFESFKVEWRSGLPTKATHLYNQRNAGKFAREAIAVLGESVTLEV